MFDRDVFVPNVIHDNSDGTYACEYVSYTIPPPRFSFCLSFCLSFHMTSASLSPPHDASITSIRYSPRATGNYSVAVKLGGAHVHSSPYTVVVQPASAFPAECTAEGEGVRRARSGTPARFCVTSRDEFANVRGSGPPENFVVQLMLETPMGTEQMQTKTISQTPGEGPGQTQFQCVSVLVVFLLVVVLDVACLPPPPPFSLTRSVLLQSHRHVWSATPSSPPSPRFTLADIPQRDREGCEPQLWVTLNSEHVKGSPFLLFLEPGAVSPTFTEVVGTPFSAPDKGFATSHSGLDELVAGRPSEYIIKARDVDKVRGCCFLCF
jgi:hypothetical protein